MALARRALGMVGDIPRPAIGTAIPSGKDGRCYIIDMGANVEAPAANLSDEPLAKEFSLERATRFLDSASKSKFDAEVGVPHRFFTVSLINFQNTRV